MAFSYPSGYNTYVPSFDASGHLVVAFSRNPKDFAINKWTTLTPVKKSTGYFLSITAEEAGRVVNADLSDFVWPDGNDAPTADWGDESFQFLPYLTQRYHFGFRIGYKAEQQADWKILAAYAAFKAQQAMTARTVLAAQVALTASNYATTHQSTAAALGGGFLTAGTTSNPYFKIALNKMAQQIQLDTLSAVQKKDFVVVMAPPLAQAIAASSEVQDYVKNSPFALAQLRGDVEAQNGLWGLPDEIYGFKLVIEDASYVTSKKLAAARAASYVFQNNTNGQLVMHARPAQLNSVAGGPSFGTVHIFAYEEMTVEQRDDPDNRRIKGRVVEDYQALMVAPATGYFLDHCLA